MSNLTDEDDEFLYGDTEADNVKDSNMNLDIRNGNTRFLHNKQLYSLFLSLYRSG